MSIHSDDGDACRPFVVNLVNVLVEEFLMHYSMRRVEKHFIRYKTNNNVEHSSWEAFQFFYVFDSSPSQHVEESKHKWKTDEDLVENYQQNCLEKMCKLCFEKLFDKSVKSSKETSMSNLNTP